MSSTFKELYSDFQDTAKLYTEKMDDTEVSFMRLLTRGMQAFQRATEYVEKVVTLTLTTLPTGETVYLLPSDCIRVVEIRDPLVPERRFLSQSFPQYKTQEDRLLGRFVETPTDYNIPFVQGDTVLFSVWGRQIIFHSNLNGTPNLTLWYIPNLEAFSENALQWTLPDIMDSTGLIVTTYRNWFPVNQIIVHPTTSQNVSRFRYLFDNTSISAPLNIYEEGLLNYALGKYVKSKGSKNYIVFMQEYDLFVKDAIENKPCYFQQGASDYYFAHRS